MAGTILRRSTALLALAATLAACGGGGGSSGTTTAPVASIPTPTPTSAPTGTCTLRARQDFALSTLRRFYLFPETLPAALDPTPFATVDDYIDALTATARAQRRDRFFTYLTSIAEEDAFFGSGSSAGFGVRLSYDTTARRVFVAEAFEGTPALAAGIDRGTEILAVGTTANNLRAVSDLIASGGPGAVSDALGPNDAGTRRLLRVADASGTRDLSVAKADFELTPVSSRYGATIIEDAGRRVGYLNLRTFISTADPALKAAFSRFRAAGITEVIVDFRYNGGGLVSIAELMGDLLGANRTSAEVFSRTTFRPELASENETRLFQPRPESIAPMRIAFIGTGGTASASELVINAFTPYLGNRSALIGSNTFGKPVGQIAVDQDVCDDRLRVVAFQTENAAGQANYFDGLATTVGATCRAADDVSRPLGDPQEASTRAALDFLAGRTCTPIAGAAATASAERFRDGAAAPRVLLSPDRPAPAQREVPGLF